MLRPAVCWANSRAITMDTTCLRSKARHFLVSRRNREAQQRDRWRQRRYGRTCPGAPGSGARMIPVPTGVRIWIAIGHTDMRKGMQGLSLLVQESLGRNPFAGDVFVFRRRAGSLMKALWHDGIGLSLYAKRLDRGRFVWPTTVDGVVALTAAQMSYLLEAIDWAQSATHVAAAKRGIGPKMF